MDGTNNKIRCRECGAVIPDKEPDYGEFIKTGLCRECQAKALGASSAAEDAGEVISEIKGQLIIASTLISTAFDQLTQLRKLIS